VRGRAFQRRSGPVASAFARLADVEAEHEADLLSYVLFDASYTRQLFALGRADAARQADEIAKLFVP
jgi:hypothetical protein